MIIFAHLIKNSLKSEFYWIFGSFNTLISYKKKSG